VPIFEFYYIIRQREFLNNKRGVTVTQILTIHPKDPQLRLIANAVTVLLEGGVIIYPTDSSYALGCKIGAKDAISRIRQIRSLDQSHNFTLICEDLSGIAKYAQVSNEVFRFLKASTPGPYTFILQATKEVPKMLQHPKRKTIGIRIPDNNVVKALLKELGEPLLSVSLILPEIETEVFSNLDEIKEQIDGRVDVIIDGGNCGNQPTTVVDFTEGYPKILREGKGSVALFG
jgi:tRNA threonylcarbamoyl adenosine modification protein (Sua5/YciO/YrdC/YwlC family)